MYLPLSLSTPIFAGGILHWLIHRSKADKPTISAWNQRGILFSSGIVAGDALIGVIVAAFVAGNASYQGYFDAHGGMETSLLGSVGPVVSLIVFAALGVYSYRYFKLKKSS